MGLLVRLLAVVVGGGGVVLGLLVPLLLYLLATILLRHIRATTLRQAVTIGVRLGGCGALVEALSIAVETFAPLPPSLMTPFSLGAMVALFGLWCYAGFRGTRATDAVSAGLLAAVCAAVVGVLAALARLWPFEVGQAA